MNRKYIQLIFLVAIFLLSGCKKNFPSDLDAFSLDMNFTQTEFKPILGQTTQFQDIFNAGESTLPLSFRISAVRTFEGKEAPELLKLFPVSIWKQPYTGTEKIFSRNTGKKGYCNEAPLGDRAAFGKFNNARYK